MSSSLTLIHSTGDEPLARILIEANKNELDGLCSESHMSNSSQPVQIFEKGIYILLKDSVLRMGKLLRSNLPLALILVNPSVNSEIKDTLFSVSSPTLIISCQKKNEFDPSSTSFHDLIAGSRMRIVHNCDPSNLIGKERLVASIIKEFIMELMK